ncbi:MAG: nitroreductase family protein [Clostridiales bacterium]|nr:nitroreductase family protein [Clostridiales bacterium]
MPKEKLDLILKAGLDSPSGRAIKPWEFIVVQDKEELLMEKIHYSEQWSQNLILQ